MPALRERKPVHDTWLTPKDFYKELNARFCFDDFDPAPPDNNLDEFDGLKTSWAKRTYCNPGFSQKTKEPFLMKAYHESLLGKMSVNLVPVSTSTKIFHELVQPYAKIEFIRGRLKFEGIDNEGNWCNPNTGMYELKTIPKDAPKIIRAGQQDLMLVIFGDPE
jgi:hypothetical protein